MFDLVRERMLIGVEPGDPGIPGMLAAGLGGILAFGSDFPHWDAVRPDDVHGLAERYDAETSRKVLYRNARDFFSRQ